MKSKRNKNRHRRYQTDLTSTIGKVALGLGGLYGLYKVSSFASERAAYKIRDYRARKAYQTMAQSYDFYKQLYRSIKNIRYQAYQPVYQSLYYSFPPATYSAWKPVHDLYVAQQQSRVISPEIVVLKPKFNPYLIPMNKPYEETPYYKAPVKIVQYKPPEKTLWYRIFGLGRYKYSASSVYQLHRYRDPKTDFLNLYTRSLIDQD